MHKARDRDLKTSRYTRMTDAAVTFGTVPADSASECHKLDDIVDEFSIAVVCTSESRAVKEVVRDSGTPMEQLPDHDEQINISMDAMTTQNGLKRSWRSVEAIHEPTQIADIVVLYHSFVFEKEFSTFGACDRIRCKER